MKKITILLAVVLIFQTIILIKMATDEYNFEPSSQASNYPPSVDLKAAVNQILDEILRDKVLDIDWLYNLRFTSFFESKDSWSATAGITFDGSGDLVFTTTAVNGNSQNMIKTPSRQTILDWANNKQRFRTSFELTSVSNVTAWWTVGTRGTTEHYGFEVVNNVLYGTTADGTTKKTVALKTILASVIYKIEARLDPLRKVIFYVDDVEVGVISQNIPLSPNTQDFLNFNITTNEAAIKEMYMSFVDFQQFKNKNK